jgi:hypothetical protein
LRSAGSRQPQVAPLHSKVRFATVLCWLNSLENR